MKSSFLLFLFCSMTIYGQAQNNAADCNQKLNQKVDFLIDGSMNDPKAPLTALKKIEGCGVDRFDVEFFGDMSALSVMINKINKTKKTEEITYKDLVAEMDKARKTDLYKNVRALFELSDDFGSRVGTFSSWSSKDEKVFEKLGGSATVRNKIVAYLRENPNNKKTYKEILESMKKK